MCILSTLRQLVIFAALAALPLAAGEDESRFDYIVVGSGAGGGPLASSLARASFSVLLLEAGEDYSEDRDYTDIPILNPLATERPGSSWQFFVNHYSDSERAKRDSKFCSEEIECEDICRTSDGNYPEDKTGIFYPRGYTIGGSTAVNALVPVKAHNAD
jgi:choline dehydrogenase